MIEKLAIFDFDGTLKDTPVEVPHAYMPRPDPDSDPAEILAYNQRGVRWLNDPRSIDDPEGDYPWIEDVVQDAKDALRDERTLSVLLTARSAVSEEMIKSALNSVGIKFDEYIFNRSGLEKDPITGKSVFFPPHIFKQMEVKNLLQQYPSVKIVAVWEDSEKNLDAIASVIPPSVEYVRNLEISRQSIIQARKLAHKESMLKKPKKKISEENLFRSFIKSCIIG